MTSPLPMPPLLLQLLLLHLISLTLAQTSDSISPSPSNDTFTAEVALEHGTNRNFTITAAKASNLLAEFVISRPSSADLVAEGLPFLLLAAAVSPSPTLVATSGTAAAAESDAHQDYKCTKSLPCLRKGEGIDVDDEAFFTRADRAAVRLNGLKEGASVVVQVHNFDREHKLGDERKLKPGMKGTIRVRAVTEEEERQCAGYDPEEGEEERNVCSGNGKCKERVKCTCETGFGGPLCESKVLPMDREDLPLPVLDEPPGGWLHPPIGDGAVEVSVPAFTRNVFSWEQRGGDSRVHVQALVMSGFAPEGTKGDAVSDTRVRMYAKTPRENGNIYLKNGPQLPSEYDFGRRCTLMRVRDGNHPFVFGFSCYRKEVVKNETNLLIAIYADATGGKGKEPRPAAVSFRVLRCDVDDVKCPTVDTVNANISIPIAVLPVCIATIGITALAIGVMLWLDRQHGFTSSVDRLSQKELDRMYPTEKFRVPQEPRREASGDQETDECLICLSKFEQNEVLRRLHCEHIYHSECLDVSFADWQLVVHLRCACVTMSRCGLFIVLT